ncbi:hypothetical protein ABFA07_002670 [Porites harrisoni]
MTASMTRTHVYVWGRCCKKRFKRRILLPSNLLQGKQRLRVSYSVRRWLLDKTKTKLCSRFWLTCSGVGHMMSSITNTW